MNSDLGNKAADLRRIANWIGRGQIEKMNLIIKLLKPIKKDPKVMEVLKHFQADTSPEMVMGNKGERTFLAEQLLVSSSRVMNLA